MASSLRDMLNKQKAQASQASQAAVAKPATPSILSSIARPKGLSIAEQIALSRKGSSNVVARPAVAPISDAPVDDVVDSLSEDIVDANDMDLEALGLSDTELVPAEAITAEEFQFPSQPDTMSPQMEGELKHAFDMLRLSIDDPTSVGDATQYIINLLQDKPELKGNLAPEDFGLMVRGLRTGYGVAIAKKSERKEKTVARKQSVQEVHEMLSDLGGMSFKL